MTPAEQRTEERNCQQILAAPGWRSCGGGALAASDDEEQCGKRQCGAEKQPYEPAVRHNRRVTVVVRLARPRHPFGRARLVFVGRGGWGGRVHVRRGGRGGGVNVRRRPGWIHVMRC